MSILLLLQGGVTHMHSTDVLSYNRKDGTIIMTQDNQGNIDILSDEFKKKVEEKVEEVKEIKEDK